MLLPVEPTPANSLIPSPAGIPIAGRSLTLSSGRSVMVSGEQGSEQLEIRSPEGLVELRIALTKDGPVLSLSGVKLEINSTDSVAVNCREFRLATTETLSLSSGGSLGLNAGGEIRTKSLGQTHFDASVLQLNSGDRSDYDDASLPKAEIPMPQVPESPSGGCCGGH